MDIFEENSLPSLFIQHLFFFFFLVEKKKEFHWGVFNVGILNYCQYVLTGACKWETTIFAPKSRIEQ